MYLNLVQIAESFGVSEKVIEDWIRREDLPHVPERGRLLFDRAQVAQWAATRGLATRAGFLAPADPALSTPWRIGPLLRCGGVWRNVAPGDLGTVLGRTVERLPDTTPQARQLVSRRLHASGGLNLAPVGGGFALPHPSARIALGRNAGLIALVLLSAPLEASEPVPDNLKISRLFFFIAPTPRAHLDLLGRLSRLLSHVDLRETLMRSPSDDDIFAAINAAEAQLSAPRPEVGR